LPVLARCYPHSFTFYVAYPVRSILNSSAPDIKEADLVEKLRAQNVVFEELIFPDEIHDLLRWSDWVRAYRATAEFFDRSLAVSAERQ
jgi:hypothetical protein